MTWVNIPHREEEGRSKATGILSYPICVLTVLTVLSDVIGVVCVCCVGSVRSDDKLITRPRKLLERLREREPQRGGEGEGDPKRPVS